MHTIHLFLYSLTTCFLYSSRFNTKYSTRHVFLFLCRCLFYQNYKPENYLHVSYCVLYLNVIGGAPFLQNTDFLRLFLDFFFFCIPFFYLKYLRIWGLCCCVSFALHIYMDQVPCFIFHSLIRRQFLPVPCISGYVDCELFS